MRYVYIAGPYSSDPAGNTQRALAAYSELLDAGFWPYLPHMSHFAPPKPYRLWMDLDFAWIRKCEALIRLPGHRQALTKRLNWLGSSKSQSSNPLSSFSLRLPTGRSRPSELRRNREQA